MDNYDGRLVEQLNKALVETVEEFQSQPIDFLYERDLQGVLYSKLRAHAR